MQKVYSDKSIRTCQLFWKVRVVRGLAMSWKDIKTWWTNHFMHLIAPWMYDE